MGLLGFVPLVSWGSSTPSTRQFGLKFLVSGLQSMGVFVLLLAGGIMVLDGKTEIGIVVAFIRARSRRRSLA
jgi:ABC-type bacteriocin/lantibiotic exporter with double-glycine peptidase domain